MFHSLKSSLSQSWQALTQKTVESFFELECRTGQHSLATYNGALMSMIRINGARTLPGEKEFEDIIASLSTELSGSLAGKGHALQFVFARAPVISEQALAELMTPAFAGAKILGLDCADVLLDRSDTLAGVLSEESNLLCCWTTRAGLNREESARQAEADKAKRKLWRASPLIMDPYAGSESLAPQHDSFVDAVLSALCPEGQGLDATLLDAKAALREIRASIRPERTAQDWDPCLYGDPLPLIEPRPDDGLDPADPDWSSLFWPKLSHQVCDLDFVITGGRMVEADGRLWGPLDLIRAPVEPRPFNALIKRLVASQSSKDVPFRVSFLIEGGGSMPMKQSLAAALRFTSSTNRLITEALEEKQRQLEAGQAVVRLRCSLATWAAKGEAEDEKTLRRNIAHLEKAIQGWGRCEVTDKTGDPLEALFSSVPGAACRSTGEPAIATLEESLTLLPLQRPAAPLTSGTHIFRSVDGKPWPYRPDTGLSPFLFDLIHGIPGMGKSVLQNALSLSAILASGTAELPFMAIIDIGPSSSGLISLIRESLPAHRSHEAEHVRLVNRKEMAVNPHDTQLGFRKPVESERKYLAGLYALLVSGPHEKTSQDMDSVIHAVIDELYRNASDAQENAAPKRWSPNADLKVTQGLDRLGFVPDQQTIWWEVVDFLFDQGEHTLAARAQRYAVPILSDAAAAANSERVKNLFARTLYNGEKITDVFVRRINAACGKYPVLSRETFFDLGNVRICAMDLAEVTSGTSDEDRHAAAVFYLFARHVLIHHWWFEEEMVGAVGERYRSWHRQRIKRLLSTPKRLCYDELHRVGSSQTSQVSQVSQDTLSSKVVYNQLLRDARETRKMNVQISAATQLLGDFPDELIAIASGLWVLGTGLDEEELATTVHKLGLGETAAQIIRHDLGPPDRNGAKALHVSKGKSGRYEQLLYNSLGARELWALSTKPEDVALRTELTARTGPAKAREILARRYPQATASEEINRMMDTRARDGEHSRATREAVCADLADRLEKML